MNPAHLSEQIAPLFAYITREKNKFYRQARKTRLTGAAFTTLFVMTYFPSRLSIEIEFILAFLISLIFLALALIPFKTISNDTILPSSTIKLFYKTYKINLISNIVKLISDDLHFRPQNRVLNKPISRSALFANNITEIRGRNLIAGTLGNHEIQMSELILWRRLKRVFSGFFIYISNTEEPNSAAIQTITQLNGTWSYTGNNLYMAFPSAHKFFEIKIEKSNHSIDIVREQVTFLIAVAGLIETITNKQFSSTYLLPPLQPLSPETIAPLKKLRTTDTREEYVIATNTRRFISSGIDFVAILIIYFPAAFTTFSYMNPIMTETSIFFTSLIVLLTVAYLYYLIFEAIFHITLGKALARTSIIAVSGHPPRFKEILIRSFARFIPFAPLAYINSEVGFHDKLSKTRVVRSDIDPVNIKETNKRPQPQKTQILPIFNKTD